jgi:hypothetical protein
MTAWSNFYCRPTGTMQKGTGLSIFLVFERCGVFLLGSQIRTLAAQNESTPP